MPNGVEFEGRVVLVGTFPIGIDPEKFRLGLQVQEVQARITRLVVVVVGCVVFCLFFLLRV